MWFPSSAADNKLYQRAYALCDVHPDFGVFSVAFLIHTPQDPASTWAAQAQPTLRTAGVSRSALDKIVKHSYSRSLRLLLWQIPEEIVFSLVLQLGLLAFSVMTGMLYTQSEISGVTAAALIIIVLRIIEAAGSLSLLVTPLSSAARVFQENASLSQSATATPMPAYQGATQPHIKLQDFSYHYPGTETGTTDVNLELPKSSTTVVFGESGSGKSTLLDVLAGLREHTRGTVTFDETPLAADQRLQLKRVKKNSLSPNTPACTHEG